MQLKVIRLDPNEAICTVTCNYKTIKYIIAGYLETINIR